MKHRFLRAAVVLGFAVFALNAQAQQSHKDMEMSGMNMDSPKPASLAMNEAVVQAIDTAGESVTIKHGQLKSKTVEMPPMTMTFPVENASLLSTVKTGDKVKVAVDNVKDQPTVTSLTVQK